ncbi:MAG: hypothetical protein Kow0089_11440 [Desulfobulbaceae bacterium]
MLRMTRQREIILKELKNFPGHPTADELYARVRKKIAHISLATVYRNLEILSKAGWVSKIEISGRQKRFDSDLHHHNHVYCIKCHRIDDVVLRDDTGRDLHPGDACGYEIEGYRVEFKGICPDCLDEQNKLKGGSEMGCRKCDTQLSDLQKKVLQAFADAGTICGSKDIAAATGMEAKQVSCQITALKKKGLVASPVRCKYEITEDGKKTLS